MRFASSVEDFAKRAEQKVDQTTRAITLQLFTNVIMASPVGRPSLWKHKPPKGYVGGRFRANWNTSVGTPDLVTTKTVDPSGASAVARVRARAGGAGTLTYLANGLPYGYRLEYEGWSTQAPAGFVRVNVTATGEKLRAGVK